MTPATQTGRREASAGALLWIVAALAFFVFEALAAAALGPAYRYAHDYISTLGAPAASPRALLMNTAFILQGMFFPAGAVLAVHGLRAGRARLFLAFAAFNGIGNVVVATVHSGTGSQWHALGAALAIAGGNAAVLAGSSVLRRTGAWRPYRAVSIALGGSGLLCLAGLAFDTSHTLLPVGVWERGSVYPIFAWQTVTAVYLLRAERR